MIFPDYLIIELLATMTVFYFIMSSNIMMLLYTAGIYLTLIGMYSMLNDADIYIGFLWVIDLGVGLVFFIFMIHFTSFLQHKSLFNTSARLLIFSIGVLLGFSVYFYFFTNYADNLLNRDLAKIWIFHITYLDYYHLLMTYEISELNTLRETYFSLNTFEFFSINFSLFFGLIAAILMYFLIQRIFNYLNYSQIKEAKTLDSMQSSFFIRSQNFISQQNMPQVVRIWNKKKK